jgi:hypothetical protein
MAKKQLTAKKTAAAKKPTRKSPKKQKQPAASTRSAFPGLASMKAAGATIIDVHYQGYGDDGGYEYRVIGSTTRLHLTDAVRVEIEKCLESRFEPYGEGPGTILLARFDLTKSVCHVLSGDGAVSERLGELVEVLKAHDVATVAGDVRSGKFSKCKVVPASAMSRDEVCDHVNRFLHIVLDMAREFDSYDEVLDYWKGTMRVDVAERRIRLTRSAASKEVTIKVSKLGAVSFPIRL